MAKAIEALQRPAPAPAHNKILTALRDRMKKLKNAVMEYTNQ